ncbi:proteoglycan 4 [Anopheles moucheti]|uniref:proteoglycan 4 n=1 Tax=Anopheles moucheti TaxID=186751 RepID=UPI0022F12539|nr:proteoglycan 4 [Anopheles moucheti]
MEQQRSNSTGGGTDQSIIHPRDQPAVAAAAAAAMFDEIKQEIGKIDPYAETIEQTYHLRKFGELFRRRITSDQLLSDLFLVLNEEALSNAKFAIQLAIVFASRQLADASLYETKIRNAMIATLQQNFLTIERLKQENVHRFYNSITLLGEYYNRKRVAFGKRIHILGQSLLLLLTSELEQEINKSYQQPATYRLDSEFAKLVLTQITLNGEDAKVEHRKEINDLLYTMRKTLIVIPNLCARAKSFLLMALDLYHGHLGEGLFDKLYGKYLTEPDLAPEGEQHATDVLNGDVPPKVIGMESVQSTQKQPATDERRKEKHGKKTPVTDTPGQKAPKASKSSTSSNRTSGATKAANPNNTTNDKENKRRSTQTKTAQGEKTSPKTTTGSRSIRLHEDGNIVATITRDTPTTPTKKHPPITAQPPSPQKSNPTRSPTSTKQKHSPRMEKLATLPKITITTATPSPKHSQDKPAAISPRAVLGPSIAKQKPHPPPKSPTHGREGMQHAAKNVPQVPRTRHDRNVRDPVKGNPVVDVQGSNGIPSKETVPLNTEHRNGGDEVKRTEVDQNTRTNESPLQNVPQEPARLDWSIPPETAEIRTNDIPPESEYPTEDVTKRDPKANSVDGGMPTAKPKLKPSYFREENVENLSWDALIPLDDESPQKVNPHTKSFLSFLASE